jgi:hypothetical protein
MAVRNPAQAGVGARHFIYAPGEDAAASIASTLEREGWEILVKAGEDVWLVVAWCHRVLTGMLLTEARTHLHSIASQHGGEYDGWETETA